MAFPHVSNWFNLDEPLFLCDEAWHAVGFLLFRFDLIMMCLSLFVSDKQLEQATWRQLRTLVVRAVCQE